MYGFPCEITTCSAPKRQKLQLLTDDIKLQQTLDKNRFLNRMQWQQMTELEAFNDPFFSWPNPIWLNISFVKWCECFSTDDIDTRDQPVQTLMQRIWLWQRFVLNSLKHLGEFRTAKKWSVKGKTIQHNFRPTASIFFSNWTRIHQNIEIQSKFIVV